MKVKLNQIDWRGAIFLTVTPIVAVVLTIFYIYNYSLSWGMVAMFLVFYMLSAMSITGGYHRLFAHKAYEASFAVKLYYVLFGAGAFQNSILKWCTDHRIHHTYVDSDKDPYSISKGFWYAHLFWMFLKDEPHPKYSSYQRDFLKDKLIMWQDKYYEIIAVFMGWILPSLVGGFLFHDFLGGFIFGGILRMVAVHHGTFFINSLSHWWGKQTYTDTNSAKDNTFAALLTFGEGFHNFDHYFANDYRNGIRWYHWDPTKWLIYLKSKLGLVKNLKTVSAERILEAKLNMQAKRLSSKLEQNVFENLKLPIKDLQQKMLTYQKQISELKARYKAIKKQKTDFYQNQLKDLKIEIANIKKDWAKAYSDWELLMRQGLSFSTL